jgi:hypothetical protein
MRFQKNHIHCAAGTLHKLLQKVLRLGGSGSLRYLNHGPFPVVRTASKIGSISSVPMGRGTAMNRPPRSGQDRSFD